MDSTIDRAGRLVVPKPIREAAQLHPGTRVRLRLTEGRVEIERSPMAVKLESASSLVVAVPVEEQSPVLTQSDVAEAVAAVRTEMPDSK